MTIYSANGFLLLILLKRKKTMLVFAIALSEILLEQKVLDDFLVIV